MRFVLVLTGAAVCCAPAAADEIDLSFNREAARLQYVHDLGESSLQVDGGWLHHSDNGDLLHVGLHLADLASEGANPVTAKLGGRFTYANGDMSDQDGFNLALGGFLRYPLPTYNRIAIAGHVYYGPEVLSLGEAKDYKDYMIRVGYNLMREADVYVGARYVRGAYDDAPNVRYDNGLHVGLNIRF